MPDKKLDIFGLPTLVNIKEWITPNTTSTATSAMINLSPNANAFNWSLTKGGVLQYVGYLVAILIVLLAILLFVHFLITPIFQFTPGGPGVIPVPGTNDAMVYWKSYPNDPVLDASGAILGNQSANWSMSLDVFIAEPLQFNSGEERILFERSTRMLANTYNLRIVLLPNTTDLRVSVLNSSRNEEFINVTNVSVQTPFRLGVVLLDRIMEVYVNGRLYKTLPLSDTVLSEGGGIRGPQGDMATLAKVKNLILWKRPITPSEMRYARPTLASASDFGSSQMQIGGTGVCS
jgi:hypothetical protein